MESFKNGFGVTEIIFYALGIRGSHVVSCFFGFCFGGCFQRFFSSGLVLRDCFSFCLV